jgi:peptide-methionine (R)-S-oxide reductase
MKRRIFLLSLFTLAGSTLVGRSLLAGQAGERTNLEKITRSDQEWRSRLTAEQYHILRQAGTERSFTSALNGEKRHGVYRCAGCELDLFSSDMKYDSKTGWPSFTKAIPGRVETEIDFKLIYPRTEYHCVRCGGHQGHLFKDGPPPLGNRYCNNGVALQFVSV